MAGSSPVVVCVCAWYTYRYGWPAWTLIHLPPFSVLVTHRKRKKYVIITTICAIVNFLEISTEYIRIGMRL